ncbi:hypothetical protein [Nonomuraea endophytica]|uniref:hypothetical protein n=1 Tax=Nonomuraea endophytica TaxID=714136 RepID=UPI001621BA6C
MMKSRGEHPDDDGFPSIDAKYSRGVMFHGGVGDNYQVNNNFAASSLDDVLSALRLRNLEDAYLKFLKFDEDRQVELLSIYERAGDLVNLLCENWLRPLSSPSSQDADRVLRQASRGTHPGQPQRGGRAAGPAPSSEFGRRQSLASRIRGHESQRRCLAAGPHLEARFRPRAAPCPAGQDLDVFCGGRLRTRRWSSP